MTQFKTRLSLQRYLESYYRGVKYFRDELNYVYCVGGFEVAKWDYENSKAIILNPKYFNENASANS